MPQPDHKNTPVLLLTFNRPATSFKVLNTIKEAGIRKLYLASDEGRDESEKERVHKLRNDLLKRIDWDCEVKTLFQSENQGCKNGVSSAIQWFFDNEEMGIILEDDCLPTPTFFQFCSELLHRFKEDRRVWMISGNNLLEENQSEASYFFTQIYSSIWGWATWRDRWSEYDIEMKGFKELLRKEEWENYFNQKQIFELRMQEISSIFDGVDTWDHQWAFCRFKNKGLGVTPKFNLIKNIGFGEDATHTQSSDHGMADLKTYDLEYPLIHPKEMKVDDEFEWRLYNRLPRLTPLDRFKIKIKKMLGLKI